MSKKDLTGQKFGKVTAINPAGTNESGNTLWLCECECGNKTIVVNSNLTRGNSKSCGCVGRDKIIKRNTIHNLCHTRIYNVWRNMKERSLNPNCKEYKYYGGRGIKICDKWFEFKNFYNDMQKTYQEHLTLDRTDVNGNYEPSNCRWVTQLRQANNKRNNIFVTVNGITSTLADTCREYNVNYNLVWKRLFRGWTIEQALFQN